MSDCSMLAVVLLVLVVAGAWALAAVLFAFLTGGMIHARDHRDGRCDSALVARPAAQLATARAPH